MSVLSRFLRTTRFLGRHHNAFYNLRELSRAPNSRDNCGVDNQPRCSADKTKSNCEKEKPKPQSAFDQPECCLDPCPDVFPRFDDIYYKPSNKNRTYVQTWVECPPIKIKPKPICCFEKLDLPPMERRKRPFCPVRPDCSTQSGCANVTNKKCVKIKVPGCCPTRDPPKCAREKRKANCRKVCTPYPAFSECDRPKPRPRRPVECNCLTIGPLCHV